MNKELNEASKVLALAAVIVCVFWGIVFGLMSLLETASGGRALWHAVAAVSGMLLLSAGALWLLGRLLK